MSSYVRKKTPGSTDWFVHDRFGMFIHFGTYSNAARHEWVKRRELIPEEKYEKYFRYFNPDLFDAREWAKSAREAGMKYCVLTTKHHEGFCLFDTQYTDYKITNTPFGRDLIKEYVEAFRAEGLRVGFYYSLIDWHHPDYPIDRVHPRQADRNARELDSGRDMKKYAEYMRNQLRELMSNYGKIDILWLDYSIEPYPKEKLPAGMEWMQFSGGKGRNEWESEKLVALVRSLQPEIIINNRSEYEQDLWTPEQFQPDSWVRHPETGEYVTWEACQTMSGSWGYFRDEMTWKSPEMLLNMLIDTVSLGGNLIMNVGPTGRGYFDSRATEALRVYGDWLKYNGRSIYGCTMAEPGFRAPEGCRLTQSEDGKRLYVHIVKYPFGSLIFNGLSAKSVDYAQLLADGSEVLFSERKKRGNAMIGAIETFDESVEATVFRLPVVKPQGLVPVIEIFLK